MSTLSESSRLRSVVIAGKEFREIFRDKRTIMNVVVSPLIVTPLLFALIGYFAKAESDKAKTTAYPVAILGSKTAPQIVAAMQHFPNLKIQSAASEADAVKRIQDRKLNAAAILPDDFAASLAANKSVAVRILTDTGHETSQQAAGALSADFAQIGSGIVAQRLQTNGLNPEFAKPFAVKAEAIPGASGVAMLFLSQMLPYILILASFGGAIYAAFDQVAGEKERGTLETLLVSPVSRRDIVLGKFAAVVGVCILSSVLSIIGLLIPFKSGLKAFAFLAKGGLSLSPVTLAIILAVMIPLAILFAGMLLAVSTYARNQKEAQTYLLTLFPLVMVPALFSLFLGTDVSRTVALAPILNASIIIKQALSGSYDFGFIALAFAASVVYAGLALAFATHLFQKESVLIKA